MIVAEQISDSLDGVLRYESSFNEGDIGELHIYLQNDLEQDKINELQQSILVTGVVLIDEIRQDARKLIIRFQKAMPPLLAISSSVSMIAGFIIGWQLLQDVKAGLPLYVWAIIGGLTLYILSQTSQGKKVIGKLK